MPKRQSSQHADEEIKTRKETLINPRNTTGPTHFLCSKQGQGTRGILAYCWVGTKWLK